MSIRTRRSFPGAMRGENKGADAGAGMMEDVARQTDSSVQLPRGLLSRREPNVKQSWRNSRENTVCQWGSHQEKTEGLG